MENNLNRFSKEALKEFFEPWEQMKVEIAALYDEQNPNAPVKLKEVIVQYERLLAYGGMEESAQSGKMQPVLLPLNGEERLAFIKKQIQSHYAFVQLDALYDETKKKAARLAIMTKK